MLRFIREWLDRRVLAQSLISVEEWEQAFAALPVLQPLSEAERHQLRDLATLFLHHKAIDGAQGLEVSRPMSLIIALQACLPILSLGLAHYRGWSSVVVYPSAFVARRVIRDEDGVEHQVRDELLGEAWLQGPVVLAWDESQYAGHIDGCNLVIHEFAHKLDMQNGDANGFPPLHRDMDADDWTRVFSQSFDTFTELCRRGEDIGIDDYAATSPAEFFAVLSEIFFEQPSLLQGRFDDVYRLMKQYYRQDPLARMSTVAVQPR